MDADREWEIWRAWLGGQPKGETIYAQVVEMLAFRQIWDGCAIVHEAAPAEVKSNATFLLWVRWNYARAQGLAIRRQTDPRSDVISLAHLIDRVWRYPTIMSRERFRALQPDDDFPLIDQWFDELAGPGGRYIDPRIPAHDFEQLQATTAKVRK